MCLRARARACVCDRSGRGGAARRGAGRRGVGGESVIVHRTNECQHNQPPLHPPAGNRELEEVDPMLLDFFEDNGIELVGVQDMKARVDLAEDDE